MSTDKKNVTGPVASVPCPHCKKSNDLTEIQRAGMLNTKERYDCDHCNKPVEIVGSVLIVSVRAYVKPLIEVRTFGDRLLIEANGHKTKALPATAFDNAVVTKIAQAFNVDYKDLRAAVIASGNPFLNPVFVQEVVE